MTSLPPRPAFCEINLSAIQHNLRRMSEIVGPHTKVMAIVKANAYGHGMIEVARAAVEAEATWLGVATAGEGLTLRRAGINARILVLGYTPAHLAEEPIARGLSLTVYDFDLAKAYAAIARAQGRTALVHSKVDTGMGRLGMTADDAPLFTRALQGITGLAVEGLFTHFSTADAADPSYTVGQIEKFDEVVEALRLARACPPILHAANSAAALRLSSARYDLVRVGIAMYGMHPSDVVPCPGDFRPALAWKACIAQVKALPAGHPVGYGNEYVTRGPERIATVPLGYGDGLRRGAPNEALVGGRRVPVVGRVCMDQAMLDVTEAPNATMGDEVVFIGRQGDEVITAEDVARRWGTINYDVTTGIGTRVPRLFSA
ncbi:MAG: alanine racemase [Chloroflexi bacterium]|nr:alanine racemase [Chloroflexota bacterium]MBI3764517.1 alanine racemase [Chloroflexota bacterium]